MSDAKAAQRTLLILLLASFLLVLVVFQSLAKAFFLAAVVAAALWPLQSRLTRWLRGRKSLAAGVLTVGAALVLLAPLVGLSAFIVKQGAGAMKFVSDTVRSEGVTGLVARLPDPVEKVVRKALDALPVEDGKGLNETVQAQVGARGDQAAAAVTAAVATTGSLLFQGVMFLLALYFFLSQAKLILDWIDDASPLRRGQTHELLTEFRKVTGTVLRSSILTAGIQATAAFVGYIIARVPSALFFALLTFFIAFVPALGAASVCLAASALLLATGHLYAAIFLAIWGVLVVGLVDNVVKPLLIKGDVEMNGMVVFFALLGGLAAFGVIGLLVGPLGVALFVAVLRMYRRDYGEKTVRPGEPPRRPFTGPQDPPEAPAHDA